jgi:hypothetical protein
MNIYSYKAAGTNHKKQKANNNNNNIKATATDYNL